MILSREEISTMIPHAGAMCLLDGVAHWDDASIRCVSTRHRAQDNPLRRDGRLGVACGVEFAAQAMAVHARLAASSGDKPATGYLASLRELTWRQERLDLLDGDLVIDAERLLGDEHQAVYQFTLHCAGAELLRGRASVILGVARP